MGAWGRLMSQSRSVPSTPPVTRWVPSPVKAIALIAPTWPVRIAVVRRFRQSQIRAVASTLPEARVVSLRVETT